MNSPKKPSRLRRFFIFGAILLFVLAIGINSYVLQSVKKAIGPADPRLSFLAKIRSSYAMFRNTTVLKEPSVFTDKDEIKFSVAEGESVQQVCHNLETHGLIKDWKMLCDYLVYSGKDRSVQAGSYTIANNSNALQIGNRIGNPRYRDIPLFIFAGWRIEEVASAIDQYALTFSGEDFLNAVKQPSQPILDKLGLTSGDSLEGYILPGSYLLKPEISLENALTLMTDHFIEKVVNSGLQSEIEHQGLSLHEGLTMASIIQRETLATEEMPLMASVFYNRLNSGMKLETDVTVQYAVGWYAPQNTWWKSSLTWDDLAIASPYNTYQVYGLPPGPLCSSGLAAIEAVAKPERSEFLFFRAACDGSGRHLFAKTYEEHLQNGCE